MKTNKAMRRLEQVREYRWLNTAAAILFLIGALAGLLAITVASKSRKQLEEENSNIIASERLLSSVKDLETSYRGFALTGNEDFLKPLQDSESLFPHELAALRTTNQRRQQLSDLIAAKRRFSDSVIEARRSGRTQVSAELTIMTRIRSLVADIQREARSEIQEVDDRESLWLPILELTTAIAFFLSFISVFVVAMARRQKERVAVERLRVSEERHRNLIENSADIIWTAYPNGDFKGEQPSWKSFTGQDPRLSDGHDWQEVVHPEDRARASEAWRTAVSQNSLYSVEMRLRRADGQWRSMEARAVPLLDGDETREWFGTHTDITEQKEAKEQLLLAKEQAEAANRAKSQFLANMSHELRTPLSAVIGYSELLEEEMEDRNDSSMLGDVQKIKANARHLLSLINDVLDLSKIEAEKMSTYAEEFDVAALLADVNTTMKGLVEQKGNEFVVKHENELGTMNTDQVKLRQCLFNLVGNAAKFTERGCITLKARREGETLTFSVIDTGIGMTSEQVGKLFERFIQADASTTRKYGGTGLGLAITRAFAKLLGGEIQVASEIGSGSTFTITVPASLADAHRLAESTEPADDNKQLVLVVDDDSAQRELLKRFLEREGFAVRLAADGRTGIDMARELTPRAILLDVMMPQMDGWSVLTELKKEPTLEHIPVVMVSFVNEPGLAKILGATETVLKPVAWDRLKAVMDKFRDHPGGILVVDDDADTRTRLRTVFERQGWAVTEAANGQEALDRISHTPPQVILLDLTMPVMDGFAFLHALRGMHGYEDIPVVVLTGRLLDADERGRLEGADRVLTKGETDMKQLAGELRALAPVNNEISRGESASF